VTLRGGDTMRTFLMILIFLLAVSASAAAGTDVFIGKVCSVERESGTILVRVSVDTENNSGESKEILVQIAPDHLPENISVGRVIRIWGEYVMQGDIGIFRASHIRSGGFGGMRDDPTGVRSRIGRGRPGSMGGSMMRGGGGGGNRGH